MILAALLLQAAPPLSYCAERAPVFQASRRFDGIWFDGLEDWRFFEGATDPRRLSWSSPRVVVLLRAYNVMRTFAPGLRFTGQFHFYRVTFTGQEWKLPPVPAGCLPFPASPGAGDQGIDVTAVTRLDDLGPDPAVSSDSRR